MEYVCKAVDACWRKHVGKIPGATAFGQCKEMTLYCFKSFLFSLMLYCGFWGLQVFDICEDDCISVVYKPVNKYIL